MADATQGNESRPAKATFRKSDGTEIPIQFNPLSLQNTVTNTLSQQGQGQRTQYVSQSSAKLTMDLIFDSTDTGTDVREKTYLVAKLMEPQGEEGDEQREAPEAVEFSWGTFSFTGVVESFKETIDFFAPEGVPLRAAVNITLAKQSHVFDRDSKMGSKKHKEPSIVPLSSADDVTSIAEQNGDPNQWRNLAAANGIENPRMIAGASIAVGGSLQIGVTAKASASASAGLSSSVGAAAKFDVGGRVQSAQSGLSVDVGQKRSLHDALQFEV
jgi:hypothetical protein